MSPALLETSAAAGGSGMIMMIVYMVLAQILKIIYIKINKEWV